MPQPSIKSRPVYSPLTPRRGVLQVMVADLQGVEAVLDLADKAPPGFLEQSHILCVIPPGTAASPAQRLAGLGVASLHEGPSLPAVLPRLAEILATAHMGTQLYLAGTEGLIGQATSLALEAGMEGASIQAEHRGSEARRVQCVHCKGVTENVTTQPVVCSRCGLTLFVRDHYSRRLAAFQGVCIDAEEPGTAPAPEEAFP